MPRGSGASKELISNTPFGKVWKHAFGKRERELIRKALRKELKRLKPDTQKWRDVRTLLACMGEEHYSASEVAIDEQEWRNAGGSDA